MPELPGRLIAAIHVGLCAALLWSATSYANYALENLRAGLWVGAVVDGLIWAGAVYSCFWSAKEGARRWK
ncbi:hypothetical protein HNQ07_004228 [Deinococcus metalli]|uniref:Uncharacterized protein n=1 Tax=Deinococcus metalli TaxID=1141878 RepID=A0A7W8KKL7_9DEIO|nr:hypothetical protein [Deinococcus metalli]MBB5378721.1 hypothetical protein [Deinococcus metalli]GHF60429.1 hypothetical protein GCM10017781_40770 [Deinococcus metalli]